MKQPQQMNMMLFFVNETHQPLPPAVIPRHLHPLYRTDVLVNTQKCEKLPSEI